MRPILIQLQLESPEFLEATRERARVPWSGAAIVDHDRCIQPSSITEDHAVFFHIVYCGMSEDFTASLLRRASHDFFEMR